MGELAVHFCPSNPVSADATVGCSKNVYRHVGIEVTKKNMSRAVSKWVATLGTGLSPRWWTCAQACHLLRRWMLCSVASSQGWNWYIYFSLPCHAPPICWSSKSWSGTWWQGQRPRCPSRYWSSDKLSPDNRVWSEVLFIVLVRILTG